VREELLEPLFRRLRLAKVLPVIRRYPRCSYLDVGCGRNATLLRAVEPHVAFGVGIDRRAPAIAGDTIFTVRGDVERRLPFASGTFDVATMLAVLEHLFEPARTLAEVRRVLKPGGTLTITVPSHAAKPVLEFLAFRIGVVSASEIADHKRYFNKGDLLDIAERAGFALVRHRYFELGFNNFALLRPSGRSHAEAVADA
jgi:SAM-dependent methyltransferase